MGRIDEIEEQMKAAIMAYDGPIKRCAPGEASAEPVKPKPVKVNKALPLPRTKPRLSIVIEAQAMKRDRAAIWLERHDRGGRAKRRGIG